MTPYQVSSEIYGEFFYSGITLISDPNWFEALPRVILCFFDGVFPRFLGTR